MEAVVPPTVALMKSQADKLFVSKDYSAAVDCYTQAIDDLFANGGSDKTPLRKLLARLYSNRSYSRILQASAGKRDFEQALEDASLSIEHDGGFAKAWLRKGQALEKLQRYRDATEAMLAGLNIDPESALLKDAHKRVDTLDRGTPASSQPKATPQARPKATPPTTHRRSNPTSDAYQQQMQAQEQARDAGAELAAFDPLQFGTNFVKSHKLGVSLWVLGLLAMSVMPAPVTVTPEMERAFDDGMREASLKYGARQAELEQKVDAAMGNTHARSGTFGGAWNAPDPQLYQRTLSKQQNMEAKLGAVIGARTLMENEARGNVGLWSEYGIATVRTKFWDMINKGTGFAKRQTMYDAFFRVLFSRSDEGIGGFVIKMLANFCMNMTIGMIGALIGFFWTLMGIIQSFNPDAASAMLFYSIAVLGGLSMVSLILGGLFSTVGGVVYVAAKAAHNAKIANGGARRAPQRINANQRRSHYD